MTLTPSQAERVPEAGHRLTRAVSQDESRLKRKRFLLAQLHYLVPWALYLALRYSMWPQAMTAPWLIAFLAVISGVMLVIIARQYQALAPRPARQVPESAIAEASAMSVPCDNCEALLGQRAWVCPACGHFRHPTTARALLMLFYVLFFGAVWVWHARG